MFHLAPSELVGWFFNGELPSDWLIWSSFKLDRKKLFAPAFFLVSYKRYMVCHIICKIWWNSYGSNSYNWQFFYFFTTQIQKIWRDVIFLTFRRLFLRSHTVLYSKKNFQEIAQKLVLSIDLGQFLFGLLHNLKILWSKNVSCYS